MTAQDFRDDVERTLREHVGANVWDWAPRSERDELVNAAAEAAAKAYSAAAEAEKQ